MNNEPWTLSLQGAQDEADGRALRLLREALPHNSTLEAHIPHGARAWLVNVWDGEDSLAAAIHADLAEAADKCREALA